MRDNAQPVLVVDDDDDHRAAIRGLLEAQGHAVIEASDGRQALEYLTTPGNIQPRVIVLDLSMPLMTGWELLAILKGYIRLAAIPVILVSGHDPRLDPVRHGTVAALLRKPYNGDQLLALVARLSGPRDLPPVG
jgi:CheY-like chemotaxis protein